MVDNTLQKKTKDWARQTPEKPRMKSGVPLITPVYNPGGWSQVFH